MKNRLLIGLVILIAAIGCTNKLQKRYSSPITKGQEKKVYKIDDVYADNTFDGARLNAFAKLDESSYQVTVSPENTPINRSPYYSFRIWSKQPQKISLEIAYTDGFYNRYIPKVSTDGKTWKPLEVQYYEIDSTRRSIVLDLVLSSDKLWVSAQELYSSKDMADWTADICKLDYVSSQQIGTSVLGRPINLTTIDENQSKMSLIFVGRQHPPEIPGGTIALMTFTKTILADTDLAKRFRKRFKVLMFPLLNPDGVDLGYWRHNANGKDLNRDWITFEQPETKAVRDWLRKMRTNDPSEQFCYGIDFHTSFSGPYLLTPDRAHPKVTSAITDQWVADIIELTGDELDVRARGKDKPYCYTWMTNELEIEAVTYEDGDEIPRPKVRQRARDYATTLMKVLLDKYE